MGMSMYISPIRKRILWALGLTQIEKDKFIDLDTFDIDGVSWCWIEGFEVNETEYFTKEGYMINWLKENIGVNSKYHYTKNTCLVCTLDDIENLLEHVKNKSVRLHYESEEEFSSNKITSYREDVISMLECVVEIEHADLYYYVISWL